MLPAHERLGADEWQPEPDGDVVAIFGSLARYPKAIFDGTWAERIGQFFTYILPILLVVNVPAEAMVKLLDWKVVGGTLAATVAAVYLSRKFFQKALRSYRSARAVDAAGCHRNHERNQHRRQHAASTLARCRLAR